MLTWKDVWQRAQPCKCLFLWALPEANRLHKNDSGEKLLPIKQCTNNIREQAAASSQLESICVVRANPNLMDSAKSREWLVKISLSSFIETLRMSYPHVDKGGQPLVQESIACTLFLCGERLRGQGCILLKTRRPLAVVLELAQNTSPCRDFCWMEVVHSGSLWISKLAENCSLEKFKGYSEYYVEREGIVSCTQTVSAHFRYFHSNENDTLLYSGYMWL